MNELRQWSFFNVASLEGFPNIANLQISGYIYDDPRFEDGTYVITSRVISAQSLSVVTENGSHYFLTGKPSKHFETFVEKIIDLEIDPTNPFRGFLFYIKD